MEKMGLNEIREEYLRFFESKGHLRLPSFSLVPQNDPSILLINAGMTPLKAYFTGAKLPPAPRVTTCQKCIRTPDIDQVGHTARHGTFFEMLGNFSFGDYFKKEIIPWAWEFCTDVLKLDAERLHVTVYLDDDEAYDIWHDIVGLGADRITRLGKADNFWEHGTGPCGPCSEIFYDRGAAYGCDKPDCGVACDCDRYIEFWNLVFTQFDRQEDGSYLPLAKKNIDTGAGLERIACVVQEVDNLFEVDTVRELLDTVCRLARAEYGTDSKTDVAIRVVTDHIRSTTMMISDGILPSNEGRGYVLRRLLRRAARYGRILGIEGRFLTQLAPVVIRSSCEAYPNLLTNQKFILNVIEREEERFEQTIQQGQALLDSYIAEARKNAQTVLSGSLVFRLHDTYGFPFDLTREIAAEEGLGIDEDAFRRDMQEQKEKARKATRDKVATAWGEQALPEEFKQLPATVFSGYETTQDKAKLLMILTQDEDNGLLVIDEAVAGMKVSLITDRSCFYANSGGQVGDRGTIRVGDTVVEVFDTTKTAEGIILHHAEISTELLKKGEMLQLQVDAERRLAIARNHTATHLMHKALREVLGEHVSQAGSLVTAERLRFDFRHFQPVSRAEVREVERRVNAEILRDDLVQTQVMSIAEAKDSGATALFDEKYGDLVRVVSVGRYSRELCGGTHLQRAGQACCFTIVAESSVAAGIRRIEAVSGQAAIQYHAETDEILHNIELELKTGRSDVVAKNAALVRDIRAKEKEIVALESKMASGQAERLLDQAEAFGGLTLLSAEVQAESAEALRDMADRLRDKLAPAVILLGTRLGDKAALVAMASPEALAAGVHAGQIVKAAAQAAGGGGGGRADMAQAGAKDPSKLAAALSAGQAAVKNQIQG